jgi:hypothetical protein
MKLVPFAFVVILFSAVHAQGQRKFTVDFGLGYAGAKEEMGGLIFIEPTYRLKENFSLGLQLEYVLMGGTNASDPSTNRISFSLSGQYYFGQTKLRLFVGAGFGIYFLSNDLLAPGFQAVKSFGYYPRIGFDYGQFTFEVDYNIISNKMPEEVTVLGVPIGSTAARDAHYFSIKAGYIFGKD